MQNENPFDLNRAIQQWRENLGQSPAFRTENLYELETHLRDSIATLQRQGLSDEESLLVALKRIGNYGGLEVEFAKINSTTMILEKVLWALLGFQVALYALDGCYILMGSYSLAQELIFELGGGALASNGIGFWMVIGLQIGLGTFVLGLAMLIWKKLLSCRSLGERVLLILSAKPVIFAAVVFLIGLLLRAGLTCLLAFQFVRVKQVVPSGAAITRSYPILSNTLAGIEIPLYIVGALLIFWVARKFSRARAAGSTTC